MLTAARGPAPAALLLRALPLAAKNRIRLICRLRDAIAHRVRNPAVLLGFAALFFALFAFPLSLQGQFQKGQTADFGFGKHTGNVYAFKDEETKKFTWPPKYLAQFESTSLPDPLVGLTNRTFEFPDQGVSIQFDSVTYQSLPDTIKGTFNIDSGCCTGNLYPLFPPPDVRIVAKGKVTIKAPDKSTKAHVHAGGGRNTVMCGWKETSKLLDKDTIFAFTWDSGACLERSFSFNYGGPNDGLYRVDWLQTGWTIDVDVDDLAGGHTVWLHLNVDANYASSTLLKHATQRPSAPSDTVFVNDLGQGKTPTCQPRSKGPVEFDVDITRYLAPTEGNGKLTGVKDLTLNQVVSDSATLRLAVYNAKLPSGTGTLPEVDLLTLNGDPMLYDDRNTGVINKTAGQWTVYDMKLPISQLRFPDQPADTNGSSGPTPAHNRVSISIDANNSSDTYCLAVDWAQISFGAQAPLMLIHGTNTSHTTWEFHNPYHRSPADYIKNIIGVDFEYKIDLVPNGSVEGNAALLKDVLVRETKRRGVQSVHLLTHSKGATDSRYFLSKLYDPNQFKVLTLYSLGTPSQGTILSDLSVEAAKAHMFATAMQADPKFSGDPMVVGSLNYFIDVMSVNTVNYYVPGLAPSDPAREQQRIEPMRRLNQTLKPAPGVVYYSMAGNADANGDGAIDEREAPGFLPDWLPMRAQKLACNRTYQALGRVRSVELEEVRTGGDQDPERKLQQPVFWYTIVRADVAQAAEPNDLVSTVSSVHCQNPCGFIPLGSKDHPDAIYPYHHSTLKTEELLDVIWDNITSRFKVKQY